MLLPIFLKTQDPLQLSGAISVIQEFVNTRQKKFSNRTSGRRAARFTKMQRSALDRLQPVYAIPFSHKKIDFSSVFGNAEPVTLEIGFGMGEATVEMATANPERNFLGIDIHLPGMGKVLAHIETQSLHNLRVICHDAREVLSHMIADHSLLAIHVYFPDPWPKNRHHKRRLIQKDIVKLFTSKIMSGGYFHAATDWKPYADHILSVCEKEPGLKNTAHDFAVRPAWRPLTKFESRALKAERTCRDILFQKIDGE